MGRSSVIGRAGLERNLGKKGRVCTRKGTTNGELILEGNRSGVRLAESGRTDWIREGDVIAVYYGTQFRLYDVVYSRK